jgi:serine phosphatase RsbU (regulator of sigma subunit)
MNAGKPGGNKGPGNTPSPAGEWPKASQFKKSIRLEFTLYVSAIMLVLMAITGYVISSQYVRTVSRGVADKLLVQARSYSGPAGKLMIAESGPDALLLNNICKRIAGDNADVYWAGITGPEGTFLAHTDISQAAASRRMDRVGADLFADMVRDAEGLAVEGDTIYITVPVSENRIALGNLVVAASSGPIKSARKASILTVVSITVAVILVGVPATILMMRRKLRPIGIITEHLKRTNLDEIALDIPFRSTNEFGFLAETIRVMGRRLSSAKKELVEKERMSRELEIARDIQTSMLPKAYPKGPRFDVACAYVSAKEVGGDYYDFIEYDDRTLGILIADVSGKSLPGMLFMLHTRDIVRTLARTLRDPARLLCQLNGELVGSLSKGMFVTMLFGVLDRQTGRFEFASAGHNPLLVVRGATGTVESIKTKGYPLGMIDPATYEKRLERAEVALGADDWVVLYTDGMNEARNAKGAEFGVERFTELIARERNTGAVDLVSRVLADQQRFVDGTVQYDDITLVALKWRGQNADNNNVAVRRGANAT